MIYNEKEHTLTLDNDEAESLSDYLKSAIIQQGECLKEEIEIDDDDYETHTDVVKDISNLCRIYLKLANGEHELPKCALAVLSGELEFGLLDIIHANPDTDNINWLANLIHIWEYAQKDKNSNLI